VLPRGDDPPPAPPVPLTKRLRPQHWAALDYLAGAATAVILLMFMRGALVRQEFPLPFGTTPLVPLQLAGPLAVLLAAMTGLAVALRRRRPVFMLGVLLVCSVVVTVLTGPNVSALTYFLPVAYVLYLVAATYEQRGNAVRTLAAVYVTLLADIALMTVSRGGQVGPGAVISVTLCVAQERLRIARELHDVVAHSMSVIAVQAGYGQYVIDSQPGDARTALGAIQATSRETLYEMRQMLGALRQADEGEARESAVSPGSGAGGGSGASAGRGAGSGEGAPLFPAPGLADLDRLVSRTAGAGVLVDVKRLGQPRDLPASIDLSAYRIVQEALTNVVKHAQTSSCQVLIGYGDDELTIEVTDNGAGVPVPEMAGAGMIHHATASRNGSTLLSRNGSSARGAATLPGTDARRDGNLAGDGHDRDAADPALRLGGRNGSSGGRNGSSGGSPGGGHGIIGMRERVTLLGGDFSAGPRPGYGFRVSARIPLPASSP